MRPLPILALIDIALAAMLVACGVHERWTLFETRIDETLDPGVASPAANVGDKLISSFSVTRRAPFSEHQHDRAPAATSTEMIRLELVFGAGPRISGEALWHEESERK